MPGARAFFDPPWITPASPRTGETVSVNIRDGVCDAIFFRPDYPQITREGNKIHLVEFGQHWDASDLCVFEIGHLAEPIGTFTPGDYTITVDFTYEDYPLGYSTITLGTVPFTVAGTTSAAPVPILTSSGKLVLLILVSGSALLMLRMRRRKRTLTRLRHGARVTPS
jgi:hypothetical protein